MILPSRHTDIDQLIVEIEALKRDLAENADSLKWEEDSRNFFSRHADELVMLLRDLKRRRSANTGDRQHRVLVEGHSDVSAAEALSAALDKAVHYFSEQHDISLNLLELRKLSHGGYRALMEIYITPITLKNRLKHEAPDIELKHIHDHEYRARKKHEEEHIKHLVFDHFAATSGSLPPQIPDYFLININDAALLNFMIEKAFFNAGHNIKAPAPATPKPSIMVRVLHPSLDKEDSSGKN